MFDFMIPFASVTLGFEGFYAVFALVAGFISRRGEL